MVKYLGFSCLILLFSACNNTPGANNNSNSGNERIEKGTEIKFGGTLRVAEEECNATFFPIDVVDAISNKVVKQMHDCLVRLDVKELNVVESIAKKWDVDESKTKYTFFLREDVYFHDDDCFEKGVGRLVKANDFAFSLELLAAPENSITASLITDKIVGAKEYHQRNADHISGIKVIDDYTLEINILEPQSSFIYIMAMVNTAPIAKEAYDKYGKQSTVGTGAFLYRKPKDLERQLRLVYNPKYFRKDKYQNSLPYLDTLEFNFGAAKLEELDMFRNKKLSILHGLPSTKIAEVVSENIANFKNNPPKTILTREPEMIVQYYEFNLAIPPFNNINVRKAFNHAIDKVKLSTNVLNDQGTVGKYGITPKVRAFQNYNYDNISGYDYNPELAKKYLTDAGYPNGKGFPTVRLEVNFAGTEHKKVATEIQRQLENVLNIHIDIEQVSLADKIEHSKYGKSEMFRSAWVADFPSPETFLSICYGGAVPKTLEEPSHPNTMRYVNPIFDSLYMMGVKSTGDEQMNYFIEAERIMMQDAPIIVLWYQEEYTLYHSEIRNFFNNAMDYCDYAEVFIKDMTEEELKEANGKIQTSEISPE